MKVSHLVSYIKQLQGQSFDGWSEDAVNGYLTALSSIENSLKNFPITISLKKRGGDNDFIYDTIIDRINDLGINCPECENIDDTQYQCTTCGDASYSVIKVLDWVNKQIVS